MASQLGPKWLNRVQQIAAPTHAGRLSRYALLAEQVNQLEAGLEKGDRRSAQGQEQGRSSSAPDRATRSTACSSKPSPWSARRPSGRSSSGITTSSSSEARRSISAAWPRWRPARARRWSRPCPAFPQRPGRQGRARRDRQRLPGPARRRLEHADLQDAGHDRRLHPDRPARPLASRPPTPATSPTARARNSASTSFATS